MYAIYTVTALFLISSLELGNAKSVNPYAVHHVPDLKIIGGQEVTPHIVPEMAFLLTSKWDPVDQKNKSYQCGGSLLSQNYVLTAAHCVQGANGVTVYLGVHDVSKREQGASYIKASGSTIHGGYSPSGDADDIAVVELSQPVSYSQNIKPVILPTRAQASRTYLNVNADTFGWGRTGDNQPTTDVLMGTRVPVISNTECGRRLNQMGMSLPSLDICTDPKSTVAHMGTCKGDSGGPLFAGMVQIGITSFGYPKCEQGTADVYVKVGNYLDWIEKNTDVVIH